MAENEALIEVIAQEMWSLGIGSPGSGPDEWDRDGAERILEALLFLPVEERARALGFEQVGWIDYERDDEERMRRPGYGKYALIEYGDHDGERYGNVPLYAPLPDRSQEP